MNLLEDVVKQRSKRVAVRLRVIQMFDVVRSIHEEKVVTCLPWVVGEERGVDQMCRGAFECQSREPDVDDDDWAGVDTRHEGPTIDDVNPIEFLPLDAGKRPGVSGGPNSVGSQPRIIV